MKRLLELFTCKKNKLFMQQAHKWDKAKQTCMCYHIIDGVGIGLFIRHADLNKDGKEDIVVAGKGGTYILFNETK